MTRTTKTAPGATAKALLAALNRLPVAFALFDARRRLAVWNAPLAALGLFPKSILKQGAPFAEFARRDAGLKRKAAGPHEISLATGKIYQVSRRRVPPGQLLLTYEDVTEARRARNEATEALERQTATAEILKVIASSPTDVQPVFDAIAKSALRLIGGHSSGVTRIDGDLLKLAAFTTTGESGDEALRNRFPLSISAGSGINARCIRSRAPCFISDIETDPVATPDYRKTARARGYRAALAVPMLRQGEPIGTISVTRREPGPFSDHHINLLKTFADQAVIAIENVRLFNETKEGLERQAATAEILKVIASSRTEVQPVFDAIVQSAARLFGRRAGLRLVEPDGLRRKALSDPSAAQYQSAELMPIDRDNLVGRVVLDAKAVQVVDTRAPDAPPYARAHAHQWDFRSNAAAPLVRDGTVIGVINVTSPEPGALSDKQMALLTTFADQAVIAIENVRLFNETREALERQTATSEVLRVISSSPTDVQPVFDSIAESAATLCGAKIGFVARFDGKLIHMMAFYGTAPEAVESVRSAYPMKPEGESTAARVVRSGAPVQIPDVLADALYTHKDAAATAGFRSTLGVPLLRESQIVGAIVVVRERAGVFQEKQIDLLKTFADQAVIAIENVRLFNETKESLERQTATAEILRVIASSPSDVQPVFDAIVETARRLLGGYSATVTRIVDGVVHLAAFTRLGEAGERELKSLFPTPLSERHEIARVTETKTYFYIGDAETNPDPKWREMARQRGFRSVLFVPMLREGVVIGTINVTHRETGAIGDHQIELLETFADQAVIAIENVRLFNETKEALERQTATADILKVIAGSPTDVQPVFETLLENAARLCGNQMASIYRFDGELIHLVATHKWPPEALALVKSQYPMRPKISTINGRTVLTKSIVRVSDTVADPDYNQTLVATGGWRRMLGVPMMREGNPIGAFVVSWLDPGETPEHQVALLKTFADQAVIAIENVRLFNETKEALEQQTATAEILQVISGSPTDTQPVFEAIVQSGLRLFPNAAVAVVLPEGNKVRMAAVATQIPAQAAAWRARFPVPLSPDRMHAAAILNGELIDVPDAEAARSGRYAPGIENFLASGNRAITIAPMMCGDAAMGAISVVREKAGPLSEKQVALLRTFAAQAVIAIENVRIFKELEARTGALSRSVEQLTALGEVGQAISSSLDLETVLKTIVQRAVQLTGLDGGSIYEYDERSNEFDLRATENVDEEYLAVLRRTPIRSGEGTVGRAALAGEPMQITDVLEQNVQSRLREAFIRAGYRAVLVVPLRREEHVIGALSVTRKAPGPFAPEIVELLKTFATQSAMAIQNARLFREIAEKGRQLAEASQHKSQFLASMSHELRTPLNAILGFNEMILGQVYGEVPADMQEPLKDIQTSGKHLLRLINNVLDLAKIEAGRMELSLQDYSVQDTVESVRSTLRPLAAEKGLEFLAEVPNDVPLAYGDSGRITQCLMNLAGNSLKFTKAGKVEIAVECRGELLVYKVSDTGVGIPPDKIASLFTEFKQTDATIASEYGGTGLGLSISRKFVEMHGGRIWVESEPGKGSSFIFEVPLRVKTT